jgi:hypothetical protein
MTMTMRTKARSVVPGGIWQVLILRVKGLERGELVWSDLTHSNVKEVSDRRGASSIPISS